MHKVIDIRGPNGSGKTYAVRRLIERAVGVQELRGPGLTHDAQQNGKPNDVWAINLGLMLDAPVFVVGPYDDAPTGGCDRIRTQDEITARIAYLARFGHVVFEGAITSTIFGRYNALANTLRGEGTAEWIVYLLDTPLDKCLERVRARRAAKGGDPDDFKPELVEDKRRAIDSAAAKFRAEGVKVIEGDGDLMSVLGPAQAGLGL